MRQKRNSSGSVSVQILKKIDGKNKLIKTVGSSKQASAIAILEKEAAKIIKELNPQRTLDILESPKDRAIQEYIESGLDPQVLSVGPELILGKIFDRIGFSKIEDPLFKDIVLSRLTYPVSKLKATEYLLQHKNQHIEVTKIYRFLDRLHKHFKAVVEEITYNYTKSVVGDISIVFYDMTTLYFESDDEDDLRKIGFSKDGKFQCPQIILGLLVAENAYPIGYNIFEGNTFEGKTLLPVIKKMQDKYKFQKPIVVADSGLLSKSNIQTAKS